ncbi:hypothetical protein Tco_0512576 [Tanacetum coccineum]
MKFLMNCPLKQAFTKCPSVLYQNFPREFWCTTIDYGPSPPSNDFVAYPLNEYLIKFSVMNGQNHLTLDYQTFCSSTGLDYNKGKYVAHPSPKAVKAELAKIVTNASYLDKTHVLGENYSSTEQINSIQQMIAYYLITGTEGFATALAVLITGASQRRQHGSTSRQSTADDKSEIITKGYAQASSSKLKETHNSSFNSDEIICSFFAQQASMPETHDDEDFCKYDECYGKKLHQMASI